MDIQHFLDRYGIKQNRLAEMIDTSPANVNKWVNGEGFPSYELCLKLLKIGVTIEELFGIEYQQVPNETTDDEFRERVRKVLGEIIFKR